MRVAFLDMDGVLVDFVAGVLRVHRSTLPMADVRWGMAQQLGFAKDDEAAFWEPLGYDFWRDLPRTHEFRSLLEGVESIFGRANVCLLSSPCETEGAVEGKIAWINRHMPAYRRRFLIGPAKELIADHGKVLIDDNDANVEKFRAAGGGVVLIPRPWNARRAETDELGRFDVAKIIDELTQRPER